MGTGEDVVIVSMRASQVIEMKRMAMKGHGQRIGG